MRLNQLSIVQCMAKYKLKYIKKKSNRNKIILIEIMVLY